MVVLRLVVWLIQETDYAQLGERAPGKKSINVVYHPENTLVGQFVNDFKQRHKVNNQDLSIKYIKEAQDDADVDPDFTIADAFLDLGKAATDNSDQRATIKLIHKTVEGIPLRAGSLVPDLGLPQYQRPIARRPPVPIPSFGSATSVLGKRSNDTAFGGTAQQSARPVLELIADEDRPVSSIEREETPASPEIPDSAQRPPPGTNEEPKSESEDEGHVPSTFVADRAHEALPSQQFTTGVQGPRVASYGSSVQALSRPASVRQESASPDFNALRDLSRPRPFLQNGVAHQDLYDGDLQVDRPGRTPSVAMPGQMTSTTPRSRFANSEGKLSRPHKSFNSPAAFTKSITRQQGRQRTEPFDVPESEIEDSQQEVSSSTAKRRRVSGKSTPSRTSKRIASNRGSDSLHRINGTVVLDEGSRAPSNAPNTLSFETAEHAEPMEVDEAANSDPVASAGSIAAQVDTDRGGEIADNAVSSAEEQALRQTESRSTDVPMNEAPSENSTSRAATSDSNKENSKPTETQASESTGKVIASNGIDVRDEAEEEDDDLNTRTVPSDYFSAKPMTPQVSTGLSVLQDIQQSRDVGSTGDKHPSGSMSPSATRKPHAEDVAQQPSTIRKPLSQTSHEQAVDTVEITDGEPERQLGLGITQSPSRRRRTSSFMGANDNVTSSTPNEAISSTRPIPSGKKPTSATKSASTNATPSSGPSKKPRNALFGKGRVTKSPQLTVETGESSNVNSSQMKAPSITSSSRPSKSTSPELSRKLPELTSTGKVIPLGMTEAQYNLMIGKYDPNDQKKKKAKEPSTAGKEANSSDRRPSSVLDEPEHTSDPHPIPNGVGGAAAQIGSNTTAVTSKSPETAPVTKPSNAKKGKKSEVQDVPTQNATTEVSELHKPTTEAVPGKEPATSSKRKAKKGISNEAAEHSPESTKPPSKVTKKAKQTKETPLETSDADQIQTPAAKESATQATPTPSTASGKNKKGPKEKVSTSMNAETPAQKPAAGSKAATNKTSAVAGSSNSTPKVTTLKATTKSNATVPPATSSKPSPAASTSKPLTTAAAKVIARPAVPARQSTLQSLKQQQAAEKRAREEREREVRKQAATQKANGSKPSSIFNPNDSDDESSSSSDSSSDDEAELSLPMKNKYSPAKSKTPTRDVKSSQSTQTTDTTPTKKKTAATVAVVPTAKTTSTQKPAAAPKKQSTPSSSGTSATSVTTSSGSSSNASSSDDDDDEPTTKSPKSTAAVPTSSSATTTAATTKKESAVYSVEEDSSSDDTDIVKRDATPPPPAKLNSSQSQSKGWAFGLFGR